MNSTNILAAICLILTQGVSGIAQNVILVPEDTVESVVAKAASVTPTDRQIAWQRDEISAFIHFGMNTFTNREWGDGTEDSQLFNPVQLNCKQWVRAAKAAGVSRMILTAKHHDGYCLWPSKFTEHCVRNSPWRDGNGDVVGEFVEACREEGMHFGIYISPWDRHEPTYGDSPKYNQYFLNQLREVLTAYQGVDEMWFDGACAEGPNGKVQIYDWRAYWDLIRELAPQAAITVRGPDVRWCGNEAGQSRPSEWSVVPISGDEQSWQTSDKTLSGYISDIKGEDLGSRAALMRSRHERSLLAWYPAQVNTSIRPGWFYHESEDGRVRSLRDLISVYYGSVGGNGQFLLNVPPDRRGLFHENDVARLKQVGDMLRATFSQNLAEDAAVAVEVQEGKPIGKASAVLDDDPNTFLTTTDGSKSLTLTVDFPKPVRANCLMLQEHLASGQRVEEFEVDCFSNREWRSVASSTVIGHKRLLRFPGATISKLRVRFTAFRIRPTVASLGLFLAPAILSPPRVERDLTGLVTITTPESTYATYTLDGSPPTLKSTRYKMPVPMEKGGVFITKMFPLTPSASGEGVGNTVMRAEFGLAKSLWKVVDSSSEDGEDGAAVNAIDDDPNTFWHTRYRDGVDSMPHHLTVDLGKTETIKAFAYTPRQDERNGGVFLKARFEVSLDGRKWAVALDDAGFDNVVNSRQQQIVKLPSPMAARYFRLTAVQTVDDNDLASAAEISVFVD